VKAVENGSCEWITAQNVAIYKIIGNKYWPDQIAKFKINAIVMAAIGKEWKRMVWR
jgi:hypothetical protein